MKSRIVALLCLLMISIPGVAQEINWLSMDEALKLQAENPKKIMMDVYTNWCGPCKMLDRRTFQNADVVEYVNAHYYSVKFDAEGNEGINYQKNYFSNPGFDPAKTRTRNGTHQFTSYLRVSGYPTIVFFDEESNMIVPLTGVLNPQQLELYLKMFKEDLQKEITSEEQFKEYQSGFVPEFEG